MADAPVGPLFLVGASRSGTAMVRSSLNRSPDVFLAGETHYFDDLRPRIGRGARERLDETSESLTLDYFLALSHRPYGHGGSPDRARMDREGLREAGRALGGSGDAYFEAYCRLARALEDDTAAEARCWGEKTPRHVYRLPEILTAYPGARAVAMYRDPRAVAASYSNWRHQGGIRTAGDTGYTAALEAEEARARASYDPSVLALLWRGTLEAGVTARRRFGDHRVRLLRYEDLVEDAEGTLTSLMQWLGLEFSRSMLDIPLHNSSFSTFTSGSGVSREPMERWRSTLPARDAAIIEMWCRSGLQHLGYRPTSASLTTVDRARIAMSVPAAAGRAVWTNRSRAGRLPGYVWRRARAGLRIGSS